MEDDLDLKACPYCGETIRAVAIRCKHCHVDLGKARPAAPDFDRGSELAVSSTPRSATESDFEQRFLEFAYKTTVPINAAAVAYALKTSIAMAEENLEDLAARDILQREIDDEGQVWFRLPGRAVPGPAGGALQPYMAPGGLVSTVPTEGAAMAGLLLNTLFLPGLGSLVAGKTGPGVAQLVMFVIGFPLCFALIGIPVVLTAWMWGILTGVHAVQEARQARLPPALP